ncbi:MULTISPECIES: Ms4533A family Cys-rich leader peptide [Actinomycetes]|uniref:Ms4533A family Cys-rich leader peptide n=1 Tax=Williamsia marianensis TaxID=85044 RepID=A0ABU4EY10_WILMA|nr:MULTISPECIES: Ms4533A family Cys-rich leader peptide [Williamsia]MDV7136130.1 Ms4533A family Cys-rich leader peptide [Williamsia muralis]
MSAAVGYRVRHTLALFAVDYRCVFDALCR